MTGDFGVINSGYRPPQGLGRYRLEPGPNANQWRIVDLYSEATYARLTDSQRSAAVRLVAALNHFEHAGR